MMLAFVAMLFATALALPQWTPSSFEPTRRMRRLDGEAESQLNLASSHSAIADAGCIVGGFDSAHPKKIYIGGPCSGLNVTEDAEGEITDVKASDHFRWVEMESIFIEISFASDTVNLDFETKAGSEVVHAEEPATHAEVGVGAIRTCKTTGMTHAAFFASTTSYLSKASFTFSTNDFVIGKHPNETDQTEFIYDKLNVCVESCCAADSGNAGNCPCANNECKAEEDGTAVVPGSYKFSILAAAFDESDSIGDVVYEAGSTGNGWAKVISVNGADASLDYYQVIDFTNMQADNLTVTPKSGVGTTYMSMTECALSTDGDCPSYEVHTMTVESDGWAADYEFPETYNLGTWAMTDKITTKPSETKMVQIRCVKPDADTLVAFGYAKASADDAEDLPVVADTKVVFLQYKFNISGMSANTTMGGWMAYDPTISTHVAPTPAPTPTPTQVPATPTPTAVSGGSGGSGENATTNATTLAPTTAAPSGSGVASGAISKMPSLLALGGSLLALAHMLN